MFCGSCGTQNPDTSRYCAHCGAELFRPQPRTVSSPPTRVETLSAMNPTGSSYGTWQQWTAKTHSRIREVVLSPVFLIAIVCYTLSQMLGLFLLADGGVLGELLESLDLVGGELGGVYSNIMETVAFFVYLPAFLTIIGLWITYISAVGQHSGRIQTAGLDIIYWVQFVLCVLLNIGFVLVLFNLVGVAVEASEYGQIGRNISDMIVQVLFIWILVGVFAEIYFLKIIATIKKVKNAIETSEPDASVSVFVAVICIISGSLSVLASLVSGFSLITVTSGASTILFGVVIFIYRGMMQELVVERYCFKKPEVVSSPGYASAPRQDYVPTWKRVEMENATQAEGTNQGTGG